MHGLEENRRVATIRVIERIGSTRVIKSIQIVVQAMYAGSEAFSRHISSNAKKVACTIDGRKYRPSDVVFGANTTAIAPSQDGLGILENSRVSSFHFGLLMPILSQLRIYGKSY